MIRRTFVLAALLLPVGGCFLGDVCDEYFDGTCPPYGSSGGAGGGDGAGGEGGGGVGGDGGGGGQPPTECTPVQGQTIGADCGVFVKSGGTGSGTQADPFGSVVDAVARLGGDKRIYVCGGETFEGSITLPSDVSIYGGLDCSQWLFESGNPKPEILGGADTPALRVSGSGAGTLSFLRITGAAAVSAGSSSIAVLVGGAETTIRDCELTAGAGAVGVAGEPQAKVVTPGTANGKAPLEVGCDGTTTLNVGGESGLNNCGATPVDGGLGGSGTNATNGGAGSPGSAGATAGAGEVGGGSPMACGTGGQGAQGTAGTPGPGALSTDTGTLSSSGYAAPTAPSGLGAGSFGQGGGGGGGANMCTGAGPGGGGGGAGGCGGLPGNGGQGGGGSFALISANASVTLENTTLVAAAGGTGGAGDAGQPGMDGGIEGAAGTGGGACNGGPGGNGGQGGAGGGGRGGPSVGIASIGDAPQEVGTVEVTMAPVAAPGGAGGNGRGANVGDPGADGIRELRASWP